MIQLKNIERNYKTGAGYTWVTGVLLGVGGAFALTRLLKDLLFQVRATEPATFVGISILFVLVGVSATYFPACRAAKVDPIVALRYE